MIKILMVDDEPKMVRLVKAYLEQEGYQALTAYDGLSALEVARQQHLDLIVLDLMLPGMDGLDVVRVLRSEGNKVPVIMLTAKTTEQDKLVGLNLGADDYVTKPFSPRELMARVRAVLRRVGESKAEPEALKSGDLVVDLRRHEVRSQGRTLAVTPTEFRLLESLMREPGRAFTRQMLMERVFGSDYEGLDRTVDAHVMNLRQKIEPQPGNPRYVQTVYGVGYKFAEDVDVA